MSHATLTLPGPRGGVRRVLEVRRVRDVPLHRVRGQPPQQEPQPRPPLHAVRSGRPYDLRPVQLVQLVQPVQTPSLVLYIIVIIVICYFL